MHKRFLLVVLLAGIAFTQSSDKGSLELRLVDPAGAVVNRAQVLVFERDKGDAPPSSARPDSNGLVRMDLPAGNYDVIVRSASGFAPWAKEVALESGDPKKFIVILKPADCEVALSCLVITNGLLLEIQVKDVSGAIIPNTVVTVTAQSGNKRKIAIGTNNRGVASADLPEGDYEVFVSTLLFEPVKRQIHLDSRHMRFNVTLK